MQFWTVGGGGVGGGGGGGPNCWLQGFPQGQYVPHFISASAAGATTVGCWSSFSEGMAPIKRENGMEKKNNSIAVVLGVQLSVGDAIFLARDLELTSFEPQNGNIRERKTETEVNMKKGHVLRPLRLYLVILETTK